MKRRENFSCKKSSILAILFLRMVSAWIHDKLRVINEWPTPTNLHELRSFIGMCSYYRRFIEKFSVLAGPLHNLTKKKVQFKWTAKENQAFKDLKENLMSQTFVSVA